jgi:hypothetical protein
MAASVYGKWVVYLLVYRTVRLGWSIRPGPKRRTVTVPPAAKRDEILMDMGERGV